jgi:hypothetical protein
MPVIHPADRGRGQRVAWARALASSPNFLAFDELLGVLDALTRIEMQSLLKSVWQKDGFTAVQVTHDVTEAVMLGDRVVLIEDRHREARGRHAHRTAASARLAAGRGLRGADPQPLVLRRRIHSEERCVNSDVTNLWLLSMHGAAAIPARRPCRPRLKPTGRERYLALPKGADDDQADSSDDPAAKLAADRPKMGRKADHGRAPSKARPAAKTRASSSPRPMI